MTEHEQGSYAHFLDEVAAGRVWLIAMAAGVGSAEILVGSGGVNAPEFTECGFIYRALDNGDVRLLNGKVFLSRPSAPDGSDVQAPP